MDTEKEMLKKMQSISVPSEPETHNSRFREIPERVEQIDKGLHIQRELLAILADKLGPVLLYDRPEEDSTVEASGVESALGQNLEDIVQRVDLNNRAIQDLNERIAL